MCVCVDSSFHSSWNTFPPVTYSFDWRHFSCTIFPFSLKEQSDSFQVQVLCSGGRRSTDAYFYITTFYFYYYQTWSEYVFYHWDVIFAVSEQMKVELCVCLTGYWSAIGEPCFLVIDQYSQACFLLHWSVIGDTLLSCYWLDNMQSRVMQHDSDSLLRGTFVWSAVDQVVSCLFKNAAQHICKNMISVIQLSLL